MTTSEIKRVVQRHCPTFFTVTGNFINTTQSSKHVAGDVLKYVESRVRLLDAVMIGETSSFERQLRTFYNSSDYKLLRRIAEEK